MRSSSILKITHYHGIPGAGSGILGPCLEMEGVTVKAIADFTGARFASPDNPELSFKRGDTLSVREVDEVAGWARGQIQGSVGWFPLSYVQFIDSEGDSVIEQESTFTPMRVRH